MFKPKRDKFTAFFLVLIMIITMMPLITSANTLETNLVDIIYDERESLSIYDEQRVAEREANREKRLDEIANISIRDTIYLTGESTEIVKSTPISIGNTSIDNNVTHNVSLVLIVSIEFSGNSWRLVATNVSSTHRDVTASIDSLDINGRSVISQTTISAIPAGQTRSSAWISAPQHWIEDYVIATISSPNTTTDRSVLIRVMSQSNYSHWARGTFPTLASSLDYHYFKHHRCNHNTIRFSDIYEYVSSSRSFNNIRPIISNANPILSHFGYSITPRSVYIDWHSPITGLMTDKINQTVGGRGGLFTRSSSVSAHIPHSNKMLSYWWD